MSSLPPERATYANRTLNVRSIEVIGYDLDYTLVHYNSLEWERRAYQHIRLRLAERGWPVEHLSFDPARGSGMQARKWFVPSAHGLR